MSDSPSPATWPLACDLTGLLLELREDNVFRDFFTAQLAAPAPLRSDRRLAHDRSSEDLEMAYSGTMPASAHAPDRSAVEGCAERLLSVAERYQNLRTLGDEKGAADFLKFSNLESPAVAELPSCSGLSPPPGVNALNEVWRCLAGPAAWDATLCDDPMDVISLERFWLPDSTRQSERQLCAHGGCHLFSYVEENKEGGRAFVRGFTVETMQTLFCRAAQLSDDRQSIHPASGLPIPEDAWERAEAVVLLLAWQGTLVEDVRVEDPAAPDLPLTPIKLSQMALAIFQRFALRSIFIDSQRKFLSLGLDDLSLLLAILRELCETHLCGCLVSGPSFLDTPSNPSMIQLQHYILHEIHAVTGARVRGEPLNGSRREDVEGLTMHFVDTAVKAVNGDEWGGSSFSSTVRGVVEGHRMPLTKRRRLLCKCR
mmetsp:Transcript_103202/g.291416  ORF Transcript_103202/g.291416 Transcript_103202/m.291416 type:complete len:427 (+) Transcript_103202:79-1359(+)